MLAIIAIVSPLAGWSAVGSPVDTGPNAGPLVIHVIRTGPTSANVVGIAVTPTDLVEVLVNGTVIATRTPLWNLDYWFFSVPVVDGSIVQTRIGLLTSPSVSVPPYVPQPTGLPGFIYAQGANLMRNGTPIQLFGPDEATAFIFALDASGLWGGPPSPSSWGNNQLFPSGPGARISGAMDADSHWREFFRYFLHYQQVTGSAGHPRPNLLRIWVAAQNWRSEGTYLAWKQDPAAFWNVFDRMVYWAKRANIYLVPILGHSESGTPQTVYFDTTSPSYAHQLEVARAIMTRYDNEAQIAMWDLWNEADVNNAAYWNPIGGSYAYRAWATSLVTDLRAYSPHHLLTMGHGVTSAAWFFNNGPGFSIERHFRFNDIPGLDVSHDHTYMTAEDQYMIDWQAAWHQALAKPHFTGEVGFNQYPGPSPYGYGYWPWFVDRARAAGFAAVSPMVFWDNGRGPYSDYPYLGPLPNYPSSSSLDFSLSLNPASSVLVQGQSATTAIAATLMAGMTRAVNLSATGLPSGATATLNPTNCSPSCTSTLTISTSSTTPTGTYTVTVDASGGGVSRTAYYGLTVNAPCPALPPSYPSNSWDRVWCDSAFSMKLADVPDESLEMFDNNWGLGVVAGIRGDDIGFRSGRTISFSTAGAYIFRVGGDDGVRGWIDGTQVLDKWFQQPYTVYSFTANLTAGSHALRVDYYEGAGNARVSFSYVGPPTPDVTPPARVTDLNATSTGTQTVSLRWTAPGDDGMIGTASLYNLRFSTQGPLNASNFQLATPIATALPRIAGTSESVSVAGLSPSTRYWFGLRTADEVPNWSPLSNVADTVTLAPPPVDTTPPRVGISTPLNGTTVSGDVQITAWATDDTSVSSLGLYVDQVLLGTASLPPYGWIWKTAIVADGNHRLTAVATDTSGNRANATIDVVVRNTLPIPPRVTFAMWNVNRSLLELVFSKPMNRNSVEANLRTSPSTGHVVQWANDTRLFLVLTGSIARGQPYVVTINAGTKDAEGGSLSDGFWFEFLPFPESASPPTWTSLWTYFWVNRNLLMLALVALLAAGLIRAREASRRIRLSSASSDQRAPTRGAPGLRPIRRVASGIPEPLGTIAARSRPPASIRDARTSPSPSQDLSGLIRRLDGITTQISSLATDLDQSLGREPTLDEGSEPSPPSFANRSPRQTTEIGVPALTVWTDLRARYAVEFYLTKRPWAHASEISRVLEMDPRQATRITAALRE